MADTNLYKILSGLYTGLNKLNIKSDRRDDDISGVIGANYPADKGTIQARLDTLETKAGVAPSALTILDKTYDTTATYGNVSITSADIITNVSGALAADATGLAGAADVYANDMFLSGKIDDIASSYLTGATGADALQLGKDGQTITGAILVDGKTIINKAARLRSGLTIAKLGTPSAGFAASYQLQDADGTAIGDTINIFKDQFLSGATYDSVNEKIVLTFIVADPAGTDIAQTVEINAHDLVHELSGSNAIGVTDVQDGQSEISLKLDETTAGHETGTGNFLSITANGLLLSGVQAAINAANSDALSSLHELSGKVKGAFVADKVTVGTADGITASEYRFGGATLAASLADTTLATEAAVKAADDALKAALSGAISGAYTDDEIVIGKGDGIEASGYKLGADTDKYTAESVIAAKTVMTEASFYKYVHTELSGLAAAVDALVI